MRQKRILSWALATLVLAGLGLFIAPGGFRGATAADPGSGSIGPSNPAVEWKGPFALLSARTNGCTIPEGVCDEFNLTVDVTRDYWDTHTGGAKVEIFWEDRSDTFEMIVFDEEGSTVAHPPVFPGLQNSLTAVVPKASGRYRVSVRYEGVVASDYRGAATFVSEEGVPPPKGAGAFFDPTVTPTFAPATIVSAHFLGSEPMVTMERRIPGSKPGAIDPDRIFVDWPLSGGEQIGQLSRSVDGGDSFRLLFDPMCAHRSRPTCQTAGGSDSDTAVNPFDGTVYFTDQEGLLAQESLASSQDHGDSFPANRQFTITNATTATDRQWLAPSDPAKIKLGVGNDRPIGIEAFLSYRLVGAGHFIQGIDQNGAPIPQADPQIKGTTGNGPIRVDVTGGPGHGWIYQVVGKNSNVKMATAFGETYQLASSWKQNTISDDKPTIFAWSALDTRGNAYVTWVEGGAVYYAFSRIDDPANNPRVGGRPGTEWSQQYRINLPSIKSAIFSEVAAGDPGRIAIAYDGTEDFEGDAPLAGPDTRWHTYSAVITNALAEGGPPIVQTGKVSHRVVHTGNIDGTDHSLLDMIDIDFDEDGRAGVVFTDNHSSFADFRDVLGLSKGKPFPHFAKQVTGPSLLLGKPQVDVTIPLNGRGDLSGDATWPNTASGRFLPALDALGAALSIEGGDLVARVDLADATVAGMKRDLDGYNLFQTVPSHTAERLQYVVRFSTEGDIFHISMESLTKGTRRFFGGKLDANDRLRNGQGNVVAAAYKTDAGFPVTGSIEGDTLVLRVPAAAYGLEEGSRLFSVTAFTMAGPTEEEEENILRTMRTVDATPPFDAILADGSLTPTPSPGATESPTLEPAPASVVLTPAEATSDPGTTHEVTALVTDATGAPVPGVTVEWSSSGVGEISTQDATTDDEGLARAMLSSSELGDQLITVSTTSCAEDGSCSAEAVKHWGPKICDLFGTSGNDFIEGSDAGEVICGFGGSDVIVGGGGNDVLLGGGGSDRLFGGGGADLIKGRPGDDELKGGPGRDRLRGGVGNDLLFGGGGQDHLRGGPGDDKLNGGARGDFCRPGRGKDEMSRCE